MESIKRQKGENRLGKNSSPMTADEMWAKYSAESGVRAEYDAYAFGDDPDLLAELVRSGRKTATSSALALYELEGEPLPDASGYSVILNSRSEAVCIVRNERVFVAEFDTVGAEHAAREGEGDLSLRYWREVHRRFFTEELRAAGLEFDEKMPVVIEEFSVVYK